MEGKENGKEGSLKGGGEVGRRDGLMSVKGIKASLLGHSSCWINEVRSQNEVRFH